MRPRISSKRALEQAEAAEAVMFAVIDGMVGMAFGEEARCPDEAGEFIHEPLARMISKMDPTTTALMEKWTDPILVLFGVSIWGLHIWDVAGLDDSGNGRPPDDTIEGPSPDGNHRQPVDHPQDEATASPPEDILMALGAIVEQEGFENGE